MSKQQARQFLSKINNNKQLQQKLTKSLNIDSDFNIKSTEHINKIISDITAFAADEGYEFTADEYRTILKNQQMESKDELSEEELEKVAGGDLDSFLKNLDSLRAKVFNNSCEYQG